MATRQVNFSNFSSVDNYLVSMSCLVETSDDPLNGELSSAVREVIRGTNIKDLLKYLGDKEMFENDVKKFYHGSDLDTIYVLSLDAKKPVELEVELDTPLKKKRGFLTKLFRK